MKIHGKLHTDSECGIESHDELLNDIDDIHKEMEIVRTSKDLTQNEKDKLLEVYGALTKLLTTVQQCNETAAEVIAKCDEIDKRCEEKMGGEE